jgi:tRNA pseudouridine55 synthase
VTRGGAPGARPRVEWRDVDGILLLDKPVGASSNDALQRARRLFRARKAGHTGSLDPAASGVLPLCFGEATKVAGLLLDGDKSYRATLALGAATATGDVEGAVVATAPVPPLDAATLHAACSGFLGAQMQVPPMYSALKRDGRPLYELARAGVEVERAPRPVTIRRLEARVLAPDRIEFKVDCSKGTYVRTLGEDLARALGTVGHLAALRRTAVAPFAGRPAVTLEALEALDEAARDARLLGADAALPGWPAVEVDARGEDDLRHGRSAAVLATRGDAGERPGDVRLYGPGGFVGLGRLGADGTRVAPTRLLASRTPAPDA